MPYGIVEDTATPQEVRKYLEHGLVSLAAFHHEDAVCIASRWTSGTGRDLKTAVPAAYRQVFGSDEGDVVYQLVKTPIVDEIHSGLPSRTITGVSPAQRDWSYRLTMIPGACCLVLLAFEVAMLYIIVGNAKASYKLFALVAAGVAAIALFLAGLLTARVDTTTLIDAKLQRDSAALEDPTQRDIIGWRFLDECFSA